MLVGAHRRMPEESSMSHDVKDVARRLLDAQVEFVSAELTGKRLAHVIARDVDDLLGLAGKLTLADVVDAEQLKGAARRLVERIGASPLLDDVVLALADAVYDLSAGDEYTLGDVVERDPVEALVAKVLSMHTLQDRALDRMAESPLVAAIASRFVTKIVGDFVQQNRERAERVPGMSSLLSFGTSAASKVRSATVDSFLGDAAGRGTQFAVRRTNSAMRDLMRDAPVQGAAMEIWELHAEEPIGNLREYLSKQELRDLVVLVRDLVLSAQSSEYTGALLDECVDVVFERYGSRHLASLLPELGLSRDDLVDEARRFVPPILAAARATGKLDALIRARLKPFFTSKRVLALLAEE
jgi:hypothetical protein